MAADPKVQSALLLQRFGLGPRPGDLDQPGLSVIDALRAEVEARAVPRPVGNNLLGTPDALVELDEFRTTRQRARDAVVRTEQMIDAASVPVMANPPPPARELQMPSAPPNKNPPPKAMQPFPQLAYRNEAQARWQAGLEEKFGFAERLVWFWSNHFCVSIAKGQPIRVLAGPFEREAIRPHIFGKFSVMLRAVQQHPAMLIYLDNRQSIGPNSRAGTRRGRGLNENLAREILELHALGVGGGYSQNDVTSLAKMLTGWTVVGPNDEDGEIGHFRFNANRHEPGDQPLMGKSYRDEGVKQAERALEDIARHPSTALFIARKLARHFIADDPPKAVVDTLAEVFRKTEGDLAQVATVLLHIPAAREMPVAKLRSPQEFIMAAARATGVRPPMPQLLNAMNAMGHPLWNPSGPNGFPDTEQHWANPEGMKVRLETAAALARQTSGQMNPVAILDSVLGPLASAETRQAVARAESRPQGIALMLMSPEFQRR